MKKRITGFTCTAVALACSCVCMAQQPVAGTKLKTANSKTVAAEEKPALSPNGPQTVLEGKEITAPEQPKAIKPGGEFNPRDTREIQYPVTTSAEAYKTVEPKLPDMQAAPAPAPSKKEAANTPAKQPVKSSPQVAPQQ